MMRKPTALITMLALGASCLAFPGSAEARWRDNSDDLPGTDDRSSTPFIIGGAVAAAALTAVLIYKHNKDSSTEEKGKAKQSTQLPIAPAAGPDQGLVWVDLPALAECRLGHGGSVVGSGSIFRMKEDARALGLSN